MKVSEPAGARDAAAFARWVGGMTLSGRRLGVTRGVEAPGALAPRAAHAVRLAAEAGDQLAGAAAGSAGAWIVLGGGAHGPTG